MAGLSRPGTLCTTTALGVPAVVAPPSLRLAAAGDAFIAASIRHQRGERFERLIALLHDADAAFVNLETLFHSFEHPPASESGGTCGDGHDTRAATWHTRGVARMRDRG
jgi:hypothetical protein